MAEDKRTESARCKNDIKTAARFYKDMPAVVGRLVTAWRTQEGFIHMEPIPIPSHESVVRLIHQVRGILFPGYFTQSVLTPANLEYYLGQELADFFENLSKQITLAIQHDCFRHDQVCIQCKDRGYETAYCFIESLPEIGAMLTSDIRAAMEGDPAACNQDEVIFSYPGLLAITVYRVAHALHVQGVPIIPRIMTEYAHSLTGIDIHPGARIAESFFIDHGTGVVVGETTEIGKRVRLYQGVTIGALSLPKDAGALYRNKKRHPTIEDDVIIYSNATILGGETVIGARSVIGGNIWITESVPPDTKVIMKRPGLVYLGSEAGRRKTEKTR